MFMSRENNAGQNQNIRTGNECFEIMAKLQIFGNKLTHQIVFMKNLRGNWTQGTSATIQYRIICLPVCFPII
jgi:hypothetical protein